MKSRRLTNVYKHERVYFYLGYLPTAIIGSHKMKHRSSRWDRIRVVTSAERI